MVMPFQPVESTFLFDTSLKFWYIYFKPTFYFYSWIFNIFPYKKDEKTGKTLKKMLAKLFFCGILGALPRRGLRQRAFGAEQNRVLCFLKAKAPFAPEPDFH